MAADDPARPQVLLDRLNAAYRSGEVDERMLQATWDAEVAAEDWDAAAEASLIFGEWLTLYAAESERAQAIEAQGAEYAARSGTTRLAVRFAAIHAFRLLNASRAADAVELLKPAIERAEESGDAVGLARLQSVQGDALVSIGDIRGLQQMRGAADILEGVGDQSSDMNQHNLAEVLFTVGDLREAARTRARAEALAQRFGKALSTGAIRCGLAEAAYHAGDWDTAVGLTTVLSDDDSEWISSEAKWTWGRILVARGDPDQPRTWANQRLGSATATAHDEWLIDGLALLGLALSAAGDSIGAAQQCMRLFDRWCEVGGVPSCSDGLAEVATMRLGVDRVGEAASLLPAISRWRPVLMAAGERRFGDAARGFEELGSRPLEAASHLRAAEVAAQHDRFVDATRHAELALRFYESVGASLYASRAEALVNA